MFQRSPGPLARIVVIAASAALLAALHLPAWAGPPYVTDDPEPVELHHWEVYLSSLYANSHDGQSGTAPHVEVNYGAVPNLQLHVIVPLAYARPQGSSARFGLGDTELGVKYRFIQETRSRPQVGMFPLVEAPTGDRSRGLGNGRAQIFVPIWIQKSWGPWTSYGGGGYWRNPGAGNKDYWLEGWLIQKTVSKHFTPGAELLHSSASTVGGGDRSSFNIGGVYDFDEGHHFLFSGGRDFHGPNRGSMYLGYQWTFGPKEPEAAKP